MSKGYNIDKAREKQKQRSLRFEDNPTNEILETFVSKQETKEAFYIPIDELYSPPIQWNFFKKLDDNKMAEMMSSIESEGLLNPILVWKINRSEIKELEYEDDRYGLSGSVYCVLAGNNRSLCFKTLYEQTHDNKYSRIPCFVYENIDAETAKYIVVASNYIQRSLNKEDKRKSIAYMYRTLSKSNNRTINVAETIAKQTNISPKAVWNELKITNDLIDYFSSEYDKGNLTQANVLKIAKLPKKMQTYIVDNYKELINNDILKKFKSSYDKKSQIDHLFLNCTETITYTNITISVPTQLKKEFKNMAQRWIQRQLKTDETSKILSESVDNQRV